MYSPIQRIENNIFIKRDDLLPFSFGGNKYRIAQEFLFDMKKQNKNCLIGYGNARSNLSRILSALCCAEGIPCYIVSPSDDDGNRVKAFNSELCAYSQAHFVYCSKNDVAETIESTFDKCKLNGLRPYYINGDIYGRGNEKTPVNAYVKAYKEIIQQDNFDYIFLATGTGMTQAGLLAGKKLYGGQTRIIGISVARDKCKEQMVISNYLNSYFNEEVVPASDIELVDEYLCGGYGKYNAELEHTIDNIYKKYGIPLDPTYTGKAFYGMLEYVKQNHIEDKKLLFLHTGGTPLFFDYLNNKKINLSVTECNNINKLLAFVSDIDKQLITPLSVRVDIRQYCEKVLKYGKVLTICQDDKIVSAILFYCNDEVSYRGYLTLLGTLPSYRGYGYAEKLIKAAEQACKEHGMKEFFLETDYDNTKAISLYSRLGYKIHHIDEKVHMFKELL